MATTYQPRTTLKFRLYRLRYAHLAGLVRWVHHWLPSTWPVGGNTIRFCIGLYVLSHFVTAPAWAWRWTFE